MIPNGGRRYYLNRSQPPLFIQMVKKYVDVTGDTDFVKYEFSFGNESQILQFTVHKKKLTTMCRSILSLVVIEDLFKLIFDTFSANK